MNTNNNNQSSTPPPTTPAQEQPQLSVETKEQQPKTDDDQALKATKSIKVFSIISLIIGLIVLVGLFLPNILFGDSNNPGVGIIVYLVYAPAYALLRLGGMIICIILLILALIKMGKYKIKPYNFLIMLIAGLALTFSPYVYSGTRKAILSNDPFYITAGDMGMSNCNTSAERANNNAWAKKDSIGGEPSYVAKDVACSYLEYIYDNDVEPSSSEQLSKYTQSYDMKNGVASITINADQPDKAHIYNIITHRTCSHDDTKNDSAISVWYRDEKENNGIGCTYVIAEDFKDDDLIPLDLYNKQSSSKWYEENFSPNKNEEEDVDEDEDENELEE